MKKILMMVLAVGVVGLIGCTKCATKKTMEGMEGEEMAAPEAGQPMAMLTAEKIGESLAPVICDKYASCNDNNPEFDQEKCRLEIGNGIMQNLKQVADLAVDQVKLDACAKVIREATCEILNSTTPPPDCEFLQ